MVHAYSEHIADSASNWNVKWLQEGDSYILMWVQTETEVQVGSATRTQTPVNTFFLSAQSKALQAYLQQASCLEFLLLHMIWIWKLMSSTALLTGVALTTKSNSLGLDFFISKRSISGEICSVEQQISFKTHSSTTQPYKIQQVPFPGCLFTHSRFMQLLDI